MENKEIRRTNLIRLIDERSVPTLEELTGTDATYIRNIRNGVRGMGDRLARRFEEKLGKPSGWMDALHEQPTAAYDVSDEALEIARRFDELSAICQDHVRRQIELLRGAEANRVRRRSVQHDVEIKQDALRPGMRSKTRKVVR